MLLLWKTEGNTDTQMTGVADGVILHLREKAYSLVCSQELSTGQRSWDDFACQSLRPPLPYDSAYVSANYIKVSLQVGVREGEEGVGETEAKVENVGCGEHRF